MGYTQQFYREQKFKVEENVVEIVNFIWAICPTRIVELELCIDKKVYLCSMEKWKKTEKKEILE